MHELIIWLSDSQERGGEQSREGEFTSLHAPSGVSARSDLFVFDGV